MRFWRATLLCRNCCLVLWCLAPLIRFPSCNPAETFNQLCICKLSPSQTAHSEVYTNEPWEWNINRRWSLIALFLCRCLLPAPFFLFLLAILTVIPNWFTRASSLFYCPFSAACGNAKEKVNLQPKGSCNSVGEAILNVRSFVPILQYHKEDFFPTRMVVGKHLFLTSYCCGADLPFKRKSG